MNLLDDLMFWWGPDRRRLGPLLVHFFSFEINRLLEIKRESHFGAYSHNAEQCDSTRPNGENFLETCALAYGANPDDQAPE
jgi:hypothetical protein